MEKLLVDFARHTDRGRFELEFVSLCGRGPLAEDLESCGWSVTALDARPGVRPSLILRLARLFRSGNIDVVHTHNTKPLLYGSLAARLAGVRRVVHSRHGQRYHASRRQTALFRLATHLTNCVVCVSNDSAQLSAKEGTAQKKIRTVWNGIDIWRFAYAGPKPGGPAVMVGRLSPEKNVDGLLRAAALAGQMSPSFRLMIAGDGPCSADLKELAAELALGDRVRFLGEVRDVPALLLGAGLFVLPSLTEGISLTLLEAMARGLPVVTTRVGGNPEVVVEGETGFLVAPRAPVELARAMIALHLAPDVGRQMGIAGRARVERHFDIRRTVRAFESLYLSDDRSPLNRGPHSLSACAGPLSDVAGHIRREVV
jgi:glycosyltransferase involved in cell wall biosynthesis